MGDASIVIFQLYPACREWGRVTTEARRQSDYPRLKRMYVVRSDCRGGEEQPRKLIYVGDM
jgi:hypothetical protein